MGRAVSRQFKQHRQTFHNNSMDQALREIKDWIVDIDSMSKHIRYQQLKCVQTNSKRASEKVLEIRLSAFYQAVRSALDDDEIEPIPMVSIVAKNCRQRRSDDFS